MYIKKSFNRLLAFALSLVLIMTVILSVNIGVASADTSGSFGNKYSATWSYNENTKTLTISGTGATPSYNGSTNKVPWVDYKSDITTLIVGEGITELGNYNFYNCTALTDVSLPSTLTAIDGTTLGLGCFRECTALTNITLPENLTTIGPYAFYKCSSLTKIVFPNSLTSLGQYAFSECTSLSSVTFGTGLSETVSYSFRDSGVKKISWGSIKTVSSYSFYGCSMTEVELPEQITSIGTFSFYNCTFLMTCKVYNSNCSFGTGNPLGGSSQSITVWGHKGSTAETFANDKGYAFKSLDACDHENTHVETTVEPTCTETGISSVICDNEDCDLENRIVSQSTLDALGHDYKTVDTINNTEIDGHIYTTNVCTRCGDQQDLVEHQTAPDGSDTHYIWKDGYYTYTNTATCQKPGVARYTCTVEGCYIVGSVATFEAVNVSLANHTVDEYTVTTPATCTESGEQEGVCTVCGETITQTIDATGHSYTDDNLVETIDSTEDDGHIYSVYECQNCKEHIFGSIEHVAWVEGNYTANVVTEPRCVIDGLEVDTCQICSKVRRVTLAANGQHSWYVTSTTDPTCTSVGKIYYACENCDMTKSENIDALGHTYIIDEEKSVAATCESSGYDYYVCKVCNASMKSTIAALGHTIDKNNYIVNAEATCEEAGSATSVCTVCGKTFDITLDALGHDYEDVIVDLTNENKPGHSLVTPTCKRCNSTTTSSISHDEWIEGRYTTKQLTSATCTIRGTTQDECQDCSTTRINYIPALGHNYNYTDDLSCDGMKYRCSICYTTTKIDPNEVMKLWSADYVNSKNIQRTAVDNTSYLDTNGDGIINAKDYAVIRKAVRDMPEHTYTDTVTAPTCSSEGYTTHTCKNCGVEYTSDYTEIDVNAHSFDDSEEYCQNGCGTVNPNYVAPTTEETNEEQ